MAETVHNNTPVTSDTEDEPKSKISFINDEYQVDEATGLTRKKCLVEIKKCNCYHRNNKKYPLSPGAGACVAKVHTCICSEYQKPYLAGKRPNFLNFFLLIMSPC